MCKGVRTPITSISLGLNVMERKFMSYQDGTKLITPECTNDSITLIKDLHNTIDHIENTLSKFCVIQDGNLVLNNFEVFSMNCMIKRIKKLLQYHIQEQNILFDFTIDEDVYDWIYGDKYNIKHCIINLIKNAIKYSNKNSNNNKISINVKMYNEISLDNEEQHIVISIIDNNQPIAKHIKKKLFQPFNSTSGSGLGLYICKKIIELHNGIITHQYLVNNSGNQFDIILKLKKCKDVSLQIHTEPIQDKTNLNKIINGNDGNDGNGNDNKSTTEIDNLQLSEYDSDKYKILLVDDSEINLKMMQKIFKNNNKINNILLANDGLEAVNVICNHKNEIDIVFIDNQMPNLNGVQTVQLLRGIHFDKLIFGVTGSSNHDLSEFRNCGLDYVFSKPFDKQKIDLIFDFLNKGDITRHKDKKIQIVDSELVWL
jgi:CheY-like chemotaxis protein